MELDRLEALALSEAVTGERERALRDLIPGTEEHYFQWSLYHQLRGELDAVEPLLEAWTARHGASARFREITRRQHLLRFDRSPGPISEHLARELGVRLDHAPPLEAEEARLATRLDPALVSRDAFLERAASSRIDGLSDAGLEWMATRPLSAEEAHALLGRLSRPDVPGLVELVAADLEALSTPFGAHAIHRRLTRAQLDALVTARPALATDPTFVQTCLTRLWPGPDEARDDEDATRRYLERLLELTRPLPPAFHSLKAHVLYHRLALDRQHGRYDRALFLEYLALPRTVAYATRALLGAFQQAARLDQSFETRLPPVRDDEPLVRDYLARFFLAGDEPAAFAACVREDYLARLFAETKLLAGEGDAARWIAMLGDTYDVEALRERVDLELSPSTPSVFGAHDPVALEVDVKNVRTLVIKVFRVQALEQLLRHGRELDLSVELDGLVANEERIETYDEPALVRARRRIELPALREPGTYVVELIGNGKSSRALIRKGTLRYVERIGAAGHVLTVLDDAGRVVRGASAWLDGREHRARDDGSIVVPFGAQPRSTSIVLSHGPLAALLPFAHREERYTLSVGFYVDREQLLGGRRAELLLRPRLKVAGGSASLRLLERARLVIAARDRHGAETSWEVALTPKDGQELLVPFQVPLDLGQLSFVVRATVRSVSEQREVELEDRVSLTLNELEATDRIEALHRSETADGHVVHVLGKTGEARPHRAVRFTFRHRFFRGEVEHVLATDAEGRIELGALEELSGFDAALEYSGHGHTHDGGHASYVLDPPRCTWPSVLHARVGDVLELPWAGREGPAGALVSLLSVAGGGFGEDAVGCARIERGVLRVEGLASGDYRLTVRETGAAVDVRVTAGAVEDGFAVAPGRILELEPRPPLVVREARVDDDGIFVRVEHASPSTRVHVFGTRFAPAHDALEALAPARDREPSSVPRVAARSPHVSGRDIGDEARYVLERRHATTYPGNLLPRPGLLLKPWAVRETSSEVQVPMLAGAFGAPPPAPRPASAAKRAAKGGRGASLPVAPTLELLAHGAATALGLRPDAEGVVRVDRRAFAHASLVRVLVLDEHAAIERRITLPEVRTPHRDLRLADALDPEARVARREQRTLLRAGDTLALEPSAKARVYATLADVHGLLATISGHETLRELAFIARWPRLSDEEKRGAIDRYGCHELFLFLYFKDRPTFDAVIAPHLALKLEKTFLDAWLLGADLERWRAPARYERLNTLERILLAQRIPEERAATLRRVRDEDDARERDLAAEAAAYQSMMLAEPHEGAYAEECAEADIGVAGAGGYGADLGGDLRARSESRRLYRAPDRTKEWAETHYWQVRRADAGPELVPANAFWRALAEHDDGPFLSAHFAQTSPSFPAMMAALAVLELPFDAAPAESTADGPADGTGRTVLRAATPAIVFHEAIATAPPAEDEAPLLVSQSYVQADDAYRYEGSTRVEKYARGELLTHTVYRCQVVIINPTSAHRELDLLLQIPEGSIAVQDGFVTRGEAVRLAPHGTHTREYAFYFPQPGTFGHFPARVTRDGRIVASAEPARLEVVRTRRDVDVTSWPHVARHGSVDEVCALLASAHLRTIDLSQILWRLRDRDAYERILAALEARRLYDDAAQAYALLHRDGPRIAELLRRRGDFLRGVGLALHAPWLVVDPVEDRGYEHLEYEPLVHARAHRLGGRLRILDDGLAAQYQRFLEVLTYLPSLSDADRLAATYYLLLQDRVAEGLALFARVDPARIETRIQYDYLHAYVCFFEERLDEARELAARYRGYPIDRWRKRFLAVLEHVDGASGAAIDERDREEEHARLAASEPALDFTVEQGRVTIRYQAIDSCELRIYLVDLELLFSRQPFLRDAGDRFSIVEPSRVIELALPADAREHSVELPPELGRANAVLELRAAGLRRSLASNASTLQVQPVEAYGRLRALERSTGRPLPRTYVKVYARRRDGQVVFYKDGYTDVRGVFDYASLSNGELEHVERFSLLVASDEHGAELRELPPPPR